MCERQGPRSCADTRNANSGLHGPWFLPELKFLFPLQYLSSDRFSSKTEGTARVVFVWHIFRKSAKSAALSGVMCQILTQLPDTFSTQA